MSAKVEAKGTVYAVGDVETFASGFRKRTLVIEVEGGKGQYADLLAVELAKERADLVNPGDKGRACAVVGFVKSRSWDDPKSGKTRWFTSVDAVRLSFGSEAASPKEAEAAAVSDIAAKIGEPEEPEKVDDLPF